MTGLAASSTTQAGADRGREGARAGLGAREAGRGAGGRVPTPDNKLIHDTQSPLTTQEKDK